MPPPKNILQSYNPNILDEVNMKKHFADIGQIRIFVSTVPALHPVRSARGSSFFMAGPFIASLS